jgi:N-sulfoglucosamine sulfohydrolase
MVKRLVTIVLFCASATFAADRKPDIVLFIADDYSWHDCTPFGDRGVRTPNLNQLATESMRFDRAYAASPTCTPSRSAMYTGLYPMRNGAHANHAMIKDGIKTLPVYMHDLGYRVVIAGKTHIGPREEFPFEYLENSNVMPEGKHELLWTDLNTPAVEKLLATHDKSQPLCLLVCAHSPHVFWMDNDGYDPLKLNLPPYLLDTKQTRREMCKYYTDVSHMDQQVGEVRASLDKHGYTPNTLFVFTADQGAQWAFAKWSLYEAGIRTPMMVKWPGHVKESSATPAMVSLVDLLPTFIEAAGGKAPADIDGRSLLPVLSGETSDFRTEIYAAHTGDKEMNHAPMRSVRAGDWKYIVNLRPDVRYTTHDSAGGEGHPNTWFGSWLAAGNTDGNAKKVVDRFYNKPPEELYDLSKDPFELKNLAIDPASATNLAELREKVKQWRIQQGEDVNKPAAMPEDARLGEMKYAG